MVVQWVVHYCKFIMWIKLCITQFRRTICDQKFVLKLLFAYNQNKVQFCPKCPILHIKFPKIFGVKPPNPRCGRRRPLLYPPWARLRLHPSLTFHFQIPSAVYDNTRLLEVCTGLNFQPGPIRFRPFSFYNFGPSPLICRAGPGSRPWMVCVIIEDSKNSQRPRKSAWIRQSQSIVFFVRLVGLFTRVVLWTN